MTPEESVLLVRYVRALCPQQKFDEFTPDAWLDILAPYDIDEIRAAVSRHVTAGNAFVAVGEIAAQIRKARNDRLARHTEAEPPYGDLDDASYKAALIAERRAIADGHREPTTIPALPPGDTNSYENRARALLRLVGRDTPSRRPEFAAPCPYCHSPASQPCTNGQGRTRRDAHPTRIEASRAVAAGEPPVDHQAIRDEIDRRRAAAHAYSDHLGDEDRASLAEFKQKLRAHPDEPEVTAS